MRKASSFNVDNAVTDYIAGESVETVARRYHIGDRRIRDILITRNLFRDEINRRIVRGLHTGISRRALAGLDDAAIVRRYIAGESEFSLAQTFRVDRSSIAARLRAANVPRRNRHQANNTRFLDPHQRAIVARKAHLSMGKGEIELLGMLNQRGYFPMRQGIIEGYNIDLALPSVAVELHWRTDDPLSRFTKASQRQRIIQLTNWGWHVIYIWVDNSHPLSAAAVNDIITFAQTAQRNESGIGQYRVIRGGAEVVATGCGDLD